MCRSLGALGYFEDRAYVHLLLELCPQKTLLHVLKRETVNLTKKKQYSS